MKFQKFKWRGGCCLYIRFDFNEQKLKTTKSKKQKKTKAVRNLKHMCFYIAQFKVEERTKKKRPRKIKQLVQCKKCYINS